MRFTYKGKEKQKKKEKYLAVNNNNLQSLQLCKLVMETRSNTCSRIGDFPLGAVIKTTAEGDMQTTLHRKKVTLNKFQKENHKFFSVLH